MAEFEGLSITSRMTPTTKTQRVDVKANSQPASEDASQNGKVLPPETEQVAKEVPSPRVSRKEIDQAVARIEDFVQSIQRDLSFAVEDDTGRTVITVIDSATEEIIRQIPSEEVLELARNLSELRARLGDNLSGALFEARV